MNNLLRPISALTLLCCAFFALPLSATTYTMQLIDEKFIPNPIKDNGQVIAINDNGQVIGYNIDGEVQLYDLTSGEIVPVAEKYFRIHGFNNKGQVLLQLQQASFLWDQEHGLQELQIGQPVSLSALNNNGKFCFQKLELENKAYIWNNGEVTTLALDSYIGEGEAKVQFINDNDQLLLDLMYCFCVVKPDDVSAEWTLKNYSEQFGMPFSMNNHGDVVGMNVKDFTNSFFSIWTHDGALFDFNKKEENDPAIMLLNINDARQCVGVIAIERNPRALSWNETDGIVDLTSRTANLEEGTILTMAFQINNAGQILVYGNNQNSKEFYAILTPNGD